jgi:hypothetical protein
MKKNVLVFGSIAGLVTTIVMVCSTAACYINADYHGNMWLGYGSMILAFSMIFVAVKNFRDKYNGGAISFGKSFQIGFYIALIASTIYVLTWLIEYYAFFPNFMEKLTAYTLKQAQENGATAAEIAKTKEQYASYAEAYKTPFGVILFTYIEILPVGLVMALIAALVLKRKNASPQLAAN